MRFETLQARHSRINPSASLHTRTNSHAILQLEHLSGATALLPPRLLAAARSLMCIVCMIIIAFDADGSISSGQTFGRWLSFLTSWTWVLCLSVLFPGLCYSLYFLKNPPPTSAAATSTAASVKDCNLLMRAHWVMWEMAGKAHCTHTPNCALERRMLIQTVITVIITVSHALTLHSNAVPHNHHSVLGSSVPAW
jgi:hypothetical protein